MWKEKEGSKSSFCKGRTRQAFVHGLLACLLGVMGGYGPLVSKSSHASEKPVFRQGSVLVVDSPTEGDLYVAGKTVQLQRRVAGDLYGAGGKLSLLAPTDGDVSLVGQDVRVSGSVAGDIRAAGGNVLIDSPIGGYALLFASNVAIRSPVSGDVYIFADQAEVNEAVEGDLHVGIGESFMLNGQVSGNVLLYSKRASNATISSSAVIDGDLVVFAKKDGASPNISAGARIAGRVITGREAAEYMAQKYPQWSRKAEDRGGWKKYRFHVYGFLAVWLLSLVLLGVAPRVVSDVLKNARAHPWKTFFTGLAAVLITPLVALLLFVTVIGIPLGILVTFDYTAGVFLALPLASIHFGDLLISGRKKQTFLWRLLASGVALLALILIFLVPILNIVVFLLILCMAMGAATRYWIRRYHFLKPSS